MLHITLIRLIHSHAKEYFEESYLNSETDTVACDSGKIKQASNYKDRMEGIFNHFTPFYLF